MRMGESTVKLPPGSGNLSLYILQLTNIQSLLLFLTKHRCFISGAIDEDLYFAAKVQIPTFPHLSPYHDVVVGLYINRVHY